jgi:tetratricopeptide (TPR) repeat protein
MQFIDGRTLAAVIEQTRQRAGLAPSTDPRPTVPEALGTPDPAAAPTSPVAAASTEEPAHTPEYYRGVARLGVQAAEALDHAHQLGVVHRDVKPANLLVDGDGRLWVTDFGLAQVQSDTRLTLTGDLVGTLRYMSPEQALAKRAVVDHRTDVYSLGATLYELLTLKPAFTGEDRQELLRQIAFEEPEPPRRINRAIPPELETIALKAMEKNPAERYATAGELADDLRRYLEDKPILARPPTLPQRVAKWARRHPAIVWAAVIVLAVTVPVLAASTAWAWHMNAQTAAALKQADDRRREADDNAQKARGEGARADDNFRQGIEEISQLVKAAQDDPTTGRTPQLEEVRKGQADRALAFYQRLLQENRTDPVGRQQAGLIYRAWVQIYGDRGDGAALIEAYRQEVAVFKELAAEFPTEKRYHEELARSHVQLRGSIGDYIGNFLMRELAGGRYQRAVKFCQQAVTMSEVLITEQPEEPSSWYLQGMAFSRLGYELWAGDQTKEAEESFSKALPAFEKAAGHPRFAAPSAWREQARAYLYRGKLRAEAGRFKEAEADYDEALAVLNKLAATNLATLVRGSLGSAEEERGNVLWAMNRREEAADAFRRAEEVRQQILRSPRGKGFPLLNAMARFYATCPDKQFRNPNEAVELAKQAVEEIGKSASHVPRDEGDCWKTLSVARYRAGDWKAVVAALDQAMKLRNGGTSTDWFFLAMAHWQLGDKDRARTWYDKAAQWMDGNKPKDPELRRFRAEAAELLGVKENER